MTPVVHTGIDTGHRRGIGVGAFLLAVVTAGAMAHVGVRMKGIEVAYDLGREKRVNKQLEEERRRLNIEIGMLKDPVRVVTFARDTLKMGPPAPTDIVRLAPGQVLGAAVAAAPEAAPAKVAKRSERVAAAAPAKAKERVVAAPPKATAPAPSESDEAASAASPAPVPADDEPPPVASEGAAE
jgi:cell division protein FtsL